MLIQKKKKHEENNAFVKPNMTITVYVIDDNYYA